MLRFQVLLSLWSVTNCLCIDKNPEVAKTKVSKPKRYSLSKLRLCHAPLKRLIQTRPHMSTSRCGEICKTPPKCLRKERGRDFYSRCSVVAAAGAMSWRHCESETAFFGLPKEDTTRNQWLSCIYNTVPEQYNANIRVCGAIHGGLFPEPGRRVALLAGLHKGCFYKVGQFQLCKNSLTHLTHSL